MAPVSTLRLCKDRNHLNIFNVQLTESSTMIIRPIFSINITVGVAEMSEL